MEQINKLLEQAAYVLLFCLGVSFLLLSYNNLGKSIGLLKNSVSRQNIIREQELTQYSEKDLVLTATRAEIIGYLTGSIEADIRINGVSYGKDSIEGDSLPYSTLSEGTYNKEYVMDEKNSITEIIFTYRK